MIAAATENVHAQLAERAPDGVEVRVARPDELAGVEFAVVHDGALLEALQDAPDLRVVQVLSAGTDWIEALVLRTRPSLSDDRTPKDPYS